MVLYSSTFLVMVMALTSKAYQMERPLNWLMLKKIVMMIYMLKMLYCVQHLGLDAVISTSTRWKHGSRLIHMLRCTC